MADIGMVQRGNRARFSFKALAEFFVRNLHCHVAAEARVAGFVDLTHSACAERGKDFVGAEFIAGGKGHVTADFTRSQPSAGNYLLLFL